MVDLDDASLAKSAPSASSGSRPVGELEGVDVVRLVEGSEVDDTLLGAAAAVLCADR